jgi:uncharacterized protein YbjT (DUF2867 family)
MTPFATTLVYCAAGAQGSAIARAAVAAGERVRVLLREGRANPFGTQVEVVRGDLAALQRCAWPASASARWS